MYNGGMSIKVEQGLQTKNEILKHAQALFAKHGYANTRFDLIGKDLEITSGAMYHHFKNKRDLFDLVVKNCAEKISDKVEASANGESNILEGIIIGCLTFIREASSPRYSKIVLEDSISVLGWKRWKEIDEVTSESKLVEAIDAAKIEHQLKSELDSNTLARFISGGVNELSLWTSHQSNKTEALAKCEKVLRGIINSVVTKESL